MNYNLEKSTTLTYDVLKSFAYIYIHVDTNTYIRNSYTNKTISIHSVQWKEMHIQPMYHLYTVYTLSSTIL